jgi:hypothetical protein
MHHGIVTTPPLAETYTRPGHRVPQRVKIGTQWKWTSV